MNKYKMIEDSRFNHQESNTSHVINPIAFVVLDDGWMDVSTELNSQVYMFEN